jgi:DNA-directed RNA polymerase specialized sigma24 family protein
VTTRETQQQPNTGAEERFNAFYQEHEARLRTRVRYLVRDYHQIEEVLQVTWIKVAVALPKTERATYSWLYKIATRAAYDMWRAEGRRIKHTAFSLDERAQGKDGELYEWTDESTFLTDEDADPLALLESLENEAEDEGLLDTLFAGYSEAERTSVLSAHEGYQWQSNYRTKTSQKRPIKVVAAELGTTPEKVGWARHAIPKVLEYRTRRPARFQVACGPRRPVQGE